MSTSGDFSFVNDSMWREALTHDYACMTPECWTALRDHDESKSFMWDTNGAVWDSIRSKMYDGHSSASMASSLRNLEHIAKYGWDDFVKVTTEREHSESQLEQLRRLPSF